MKIGVIIRNRDPLSLLVYRKNLETELKPLGCDIIPFAEGAAAPRGCDIIWDPGLGMRSIPKSLLESPIPVVVTVHGLRAFSLPLSELTRGVIHRGREYMLKRSVMYSWGKFRDKVAAIIAVSQYGAREVTAAFGINSPIVFPIYHGTDHETFRPEGSVHTMRRPYFLTVGEYAPIKNFDRVYEAYRRLTYPEPPYLAMVMPGYTGSAIHGKGVVIIKRRLDHDELASWYRGALGLIFPSLRETFGLPILEAMSCGCPVITSHGTGCLEVAGDAAILVDPRSVDQITGSMARLIEDAEFRNTLRLKGIARAQQFTWGKSAQEHVRVFDLVLSGKLNQS